MAEIFAIAIVCLTVAGLAASAAFFVIAVVIGMAIAFYENVVKCAR